MTIDSTESLIVEHFVSARYCTPFGHMTAVGIVAHSREVICE